MKCKATRIIFILPFQPPSSISLHEPHFSRRSASVVPSIIPPPDSRKRLSDKRRKPYLLSSIISAVFAPNQWTRINYIPLFLSKPFRHTCAIAIPSSSSGISELPCALPSLFQAVTPCRTNPNVVNSKHPSLYLVINSKIYKADINGISPLTYIQSDLNTLSINASVYR